MVGERLCIFLAFPSTAVQSIQLGAEWTAHTYLAALEVQTLHCGERQLNMSAEELEVVKGGEQHITSSNCTLVHCTLRV